MEGRFTLLFYILFCASTTVSAQTTIYARANGDWNDNAASTGTWSTVGPGGTACACIPSASDSVVIDGYTVTVTAAGDCKDLTIKTSSTLSVNNNVGLNINNSGRVWLQSGGAISHSGINSNSYLYFKTGAPEMEIESGFTFNLDDIVIDGTDSLTISGSGNLTLTDDISFVGANAYVTNNLTGNLNLTGTSNSSLWYKTSSSGCTFINNGPLSIDRYLYIQAANSVFTNNDTVELTNASFGLVLTTGDAGGTVITNSANSQITIAGQFNAGSNQMTFNNYGTLDLEGNLSAWSGSASSDFYNYANSTLYYAGTGQFYGKFYSNYSGNTVVFDNTSSLQNELISPEDNYWNLSFSGFQKQIKTSLVCRGNFSTSTNAYITASRSISMYDGGSFTIADGGSLTRSSGSGSITFNNDYTYSFIVNDATTGYAWDFIYIDSNTTVNISGSGKIDLDNDFLFTGINTTVNNDLTGSFTVGGSLYWQAASSGNTFVNNETMSITTLLQYAGTSNAFTNNGTLTIGTDLLFNSTTSCAFTNNASGNVTVNSDLNFTSSTKTKVSNAGTMLIKETSQFGGISFSGTLDSLVNSGTLVDSTKLRVLSSSNDDNVVINSSGGNMTVYGDFQLNDADFLFDNYGTFNLVGAFDDMAGAESIYNQANGTINYQGKHNTPLNTEIALYCNYSNSTFNYTRSDGTLQEILVPQDAYYHLTLSGSGKKEPQGALDINGDVTISGSATFDPYTNNNNLTVAGNWTSTSSSAFEEGTEEVTFDGTGSQFILTTGGEEFYNLTVNKASGTLSLSSAVTVSNILKLTAGDCDLNGQTLTLSQASASSLERTSGGLISDQSDHSSKLVRNVGTTTGSYLFPFSTTSGAYIPFTLELTAGDMGNVTVSTYGTGSDNLPWPSSPDSVKHLNTHSMLSPDNRNNTIDRFWQIDKTGASGTANITFTYADDDVSSDVIGNESELLAQRYDTSTDKWDFSLAGQVTNATNNTVYVPSVSSFSPWSLALSGSPLPIKLLNFEALLKGDQVDLLWSTESEVNNDYFTIEKSIDNTTFKPVKKVAGAGTHNGTLHYAETDYEVADGLSYYRLKQTDRDGQHSYSSLVMIDKPKNHQTSIQLYPNPTQPGNIRLKLENEQEQAVWITITDYNGNSYFSQTMESNEITEDYRLPLQKGLPPGMYLVRVYLLEMTFQCKLIINSLSE